MRIQHNIMAMNAYRNYNTNNSALSKNLEKLSSGYAINRAGDDAAGLAISEKMRAQITGLSTAQGNAQSGINLVQTTEGALTEVHDMLNRMYELANQSANGTYDEIDREQLNKEVDALKEEINRIADSTNFNGIQVLDGSLGLNTDAFKMASVAAQKAANVTGDIVTTKMPDEGPTVGTDTILSKPGTEAQAGSVTIDLSQLSMKPTNGTTKAKIDITINGKTFSVESGTAGDELTGKDIASLLAAEINKANGNKGLLVGNADNTGLIYEASDNSDGTITLTTKYDGAGTALTDGKPTSNTNDANLKINWSITSAANGGTGTVSGGQNIGSTVITAPTKEEKAQFANTFLKLDMSKIKDGMVLEIAGEKYTFAVGKDSKVTGSNVIDLKDLDLSKSVDQTEALNRLTKAASSNATFTVGHDGNGNLTLAEKTDGAGKSLASEEMKKKMSTIDGLRSLVKISSAAKNVATEISATAGSIKDGDVLTINGKKYTFTNDETKTGAGYIQMGTDGADAMKNLEDALKADGYTTELDGDKLTVYAKTSEDDAPMVLGNGLTLQIGDTSDSFNKLSVLVQDMHANSLGVSGIDISSQDGAAKATDLIKAAINTVSDVRGTLGATQNRLEHTINSLSVTEENITSSESSIRDTDVAEEMMAYTKNNILIQSAQAMLAQANQVPQGVLQLLG